MLTVRRDRVAWCGWGLSLLAIPATIDTIAIHTGRETMSRLWARGLLHPIAGPIVAGASVGLAWHLAQTVLDELGFRAEVATLTGPAP